MTEQEQREYNDSRALDVMTDDGPRETVSVPLPRRPFVGLRPRKSVSQQKREARRMAYPFCGTTLIELDVGVYAEAHRSPELWSAEPIHGPDGKPIGTVLTIYVE